MGDTRQQELFQDIILKAGEGMALESKKVQNQPQTQNMPQHDTLRIARALLMRERETVKGAICPCCDQFAKVYRRKLNSGIAVALIALYRLSLRQRISTEVDQPYYHVNEIATELHAMKFRNQMAAAQIPLARFWCLVEEELNANTSKSQSGKWRFTSAGWDFLRRRGNKSTIAKYVLLYNNQALGYAGPDVTIDNCLGQHFNYQDLMVGI